MTKGPPRTSTDEQRAGDELGPPASVLLVDDHVPNLLALEAILAPLGQRLVRATSGEAALKRLLAGDFALILMDVQMPDLDGFQTAAMIKQSRRTRDLPIIFLTAINDDAAHVFAGYEHGAVDYLTKPFDPVILRSKVAVFVDLYRQRETIRRQAALLREREREAQARQSERRLRSLTDAMPQCVWAAHADGTFYYCNRVWLEYSGLTEEQALAGGSRDTLHPDDLAAARESWVEALRTGSPVELQYRLRRRDGAYRWHLSRAVPERDERGALVGWIATATDIDEQRREQEARARLLEREQEARAQAEHAQRAAEAASRTKDEFLATVSHELRTPLNAILGWARMLRGGVLPEAKRGRALETIERNAAAQAQLIEDILDVSRITQGKLRVELRPVDLAALAEAAVDAVRPTADAKGVALEARREGGPDAGGFHVAGDADRLQQVLWNLLSNAIKFTPKGGRVELALRRDGGDAELEVADTGEGIPPGFLPYVFDRFRQADGTTTRTHSGLGLGLSIVRHLVELHGGSVRVRSEGQARGATFTVRLPLRAPAQDARAAAAEPGAPGDAPDAPRAAGDRGPDGGAAPPGLQGVTVLVVDDEADAREVVAVALEHRGARVESAASAAAALERMAAGPPDVLVSDIGMPDADGYALIARVRELDAARGGRLPAVALTAYARPEDRARVLAAGFDAHLPKPVDPSELAALVARMAGRAPPPAAA